MTLEPGERADFRRLTALNILANVSVPVASLADTAMLGRLADIRFLAGVALATVLFDYLYWSFGFLRMGTTGLTAVAAGRDDRPELTAILYRAVLSSLVLGTLILALGRPIGDLGFRLLTGATEVETAGRAYFEARVWAAPAVLVNFACIGWMLGRGRSGQVLVATVVASLANIAFNYWFIVHLDWQAFGAGLGTTLSQYLMLMMNIVLIARSPDLQWPDWSRVLAIDRLRALARLNGDLLVRTFCLLTAFALFTNVSAVFGTTVLAANTILLRLLTFAAYAIDGVAFATETLAGRFLGRADRRNLLSLLRLALSTGITFAVAFVAVLLLAPATLLGLLTSHHEVVALAVLNAPWLAVTLLLGAAAYVLDGFFLGLTAGRTLRNSMILSLLLAIVPLGWLAYRWASNPLLWAALALFMALRAGTLAAAVPAVLRPTSGRPRG